MSTWAGRMNGWAWILFGRTKWVWLEAALQQHIECPNEFHQWWTTTISMASLKSCVVCEHQAQRTINAMEIMRSNVEHGQLTWWNFLENGFCHKILEPLSIEWWSTDRYSVLMRKKRKVHVPLVRNWCIAFESGRICMCVTYPIVDNTFESVFQFLLQSIRLQYINDTDEEKQPLALLTPRWYAARPRRMPRNQQSTIIVIVMHGRR